MLTSDNSFLLPHLLRCSLIDGERLVHGFPPPYKDLFKHLIIFMSINLPSWTCEPLHAALFQRQELSLLELPPEIESISNVQLQGVFFHWASPKMLEYPNWASQKKLKYPNWASP